MILIEAIEYYGRAAEQGVMTKKEAAHRLYQFSDGSLTLKGAAELVAEWGTTRAKYAKGRELVRKELERYKGEGA